MEEIKRYEIYNGLLYSKGKDGACFSISIPNKEVVLLEDHLAALREIFPDWPGGYPTEEGDYYFEGSDDNHTQAVAQVEMRNGVLMVDNGSFRVDETEPRQWGPRVPKWREVKR